MTTPELTRAQLLGGGLAGAAFVALGPLAGAARGQRVAGDAELLSLGVTLEGVQRTFYRQGLDRVSGLSREERRVLRRIAEEEEAHLGGAIDLLETIGGDPRPPDRLDDATEGLPSADELSFGEAFSSPRRFLAAAERLENFAVRAYNGLAARMSQRSVLLATASVAQVEARHAAAIAELRGRPPKAGAFDSGLTPDAVRRTLRRRYFG